MATVTTDLTGKTFVITGANSGIGYIAARHFASHGATTVLICRDETRGQQAKAQIVQDTGNPRVALYLADFSSLASVSRVADAIAADYPQIDVLCNNAGGANGVRTVTEEGFETTFVTNHLSGFLLTQKLLPALLHNPDHALRRVVFTSSYGHTHSPLDFDDLGLEKDYKTLKAYGRSKLMNLLTAREMQRRFGDQHLVASAFHPGAVRTPIWGKGGRVARVLGLVLYPFMVSVEKGADTLVWLACAEDADSVHANGRYFVKRTPTTPARFATDDAAQTLWLHSEKLIAPYLH